MKLSCIIIEDREEDREILQAYIEDSDKLSLVAQFSNVIDARDYLAREEPDIIFSDIMMGDSDGLTLIRSLENPPQVIFTTSFPNFAVTGFELDATDYLVKPFAYKRFCQAVDKAVAKHAAKAPSPLPEMDIPSPDEDHFFIRSEHSIIRINYDDVIYIEGLKDYVKIITPQKTYLTSMHLKVIEDRLPANLFMRVHRSFIINLSKIESLNNYEIIVGGKSVSLGESYRENLLKTVVEGKMITKRGG
jgi:DNA-binding LytR/AlgR family response regulator